MRAIISVGALGSEPAAVKGGYEDRRYSTDSNLKVVLEGSYEIHRNDSRLHFRTLLNGSEAIHKFIATTDFSEIYYSQSFEGMTDKDPLEKDGAAWGAFEKGIMPNYFKQWAMCQCLVLATVMLERPEIMVKDGEIPLTAVPGFIRRRVAELDLQVPVSLRSKVVLGDKPTAAFWLVRKGVDVSELKTGKDCFLLARISVLDAHAKLPTKISAHHFHPVGTKTEFVTSEPVFLAEFVGKPTEYRQDVFTSLAYEADTKVIVKDFRFGDNYSYMLNKTEKPPFAADRDSHSKVEGRAIAKVEDERSKKKKSHAVISALFLTLIPLWLFTKNRLLG